MKDLRQKLIYRHIGWLYSLRSQLLIPTSWEHISQNKHIASTTRRRMQRFGVGLLEDGISEKMLKKFLPTDEYGRLINYKNTATQIMVMTRIISVVSCSMNVRLPRTGEILLRQRKVSYSPARNRSAYSRAILVLAINMSSCREQAVSLPSMARASSHWALG